MSQMIGTLAHYRILEEVGKGGMGVVYKAHDTSLDRPVAIKVMPAAVSADPELRTRFLAEARHAARISHPNIATVHEADEAELTLDSETTPRPVLYIAMEFIEGYDLEEKMASGNMTLEETLEIGIQISAGLEAAHAQKVVHRDLKPHNIRLTQDGRVKIVDFGLAKSFRDGAGALPGEPSLVRPQLTRTGMMVGTPGYMAPEQAEGTEVDSRTDLFSLGILLYRMTSGKLPFSNANYVKFLKALLSEEPEPLSESNSSIPGELQLIVARLLQKDPEQRFQSAQEVRLALRRLAGGSTDEITVGLATPTATTRATAVRGPSDRTWPKVTAALVAALVLAATAFWLLSDRGTAPREILEVRTHFTTTAEEPRCAELAEEINSSLTQAPKIVLVRKEGGENDLDLQIDCKVEEDGFVAKLQLSQQGGAYTILDRSFVFRGDSKYWPPFKAELDFQLKRALYLALAGQRMRRVAEDPALLADKLSSFYQAVQLLDDYAGPRDLNQAVSAFQRILKIDDDFALAHAGLSEAIYHLNRDSMTGDNLARAEAAANRALELDADLAEGRIALAQTLFSRSRYDEAEALLMQVLAQGESPDAYYWLGKVNKNRQELELAEIRYNKAIELRPGYWRYYNALAALEAKQGHIEAAEEMTRAAVDLSPPGVNTPATNLVAFRLLAGDFDGAAEAAELIRPPLLYAAHASQKGTAYFYAGQFAEAEKFFTIATQLEAQDASYFAALGDALLAQGKPASKAYRDALALADELLEANPDHPKYSSWKPTYLAKLGACDEAVASAEKKLEDPPRELDYLNALAKVHALCGNDERALEILEEVVQGLGLPLLEKEIEFWTLLGKPEALDRLRSAMQATSES